MREKKTNVTSVNVFLFQLRARVYVCSDSLSLSTERVFATIGNVQETVFVLEIVIDLAHGGRRLRYGLVDKQKDGLLRRQLYTLADNPHKLRHRNVVGHQKLALVYLGYKRIGHSFYHDLFFPKTT